MSLYQRLKNLLSGAKTLGERSVELMAPQLAGCIICGKAVSQAVNINSTRAQGSFSILNRSLCAKCLYSIPWLDSIVCPICGRGTECPDCSRMSRRSFLYNRSAVAYDSVMREWLAQYKYRGNERLAPLLAEMLLPALVKLAGEAKRRLEGPCHPLPGKSTVSGQTFSKLSLLRNHENDNLWQSWDAITYVPISAERAEERGFNQAEQMAVHLSSTLRIPLYELLIRPKHSGKMSFKSRAERIRGSQSLFEANAIAVCSLLGTSSIGSHVHQPSLKQAPLNIVLVDDIYTTGSTAQSCASALKNSIVRPINVYVLTWARS